MPKKCPPEADHFCCNSPLQPAVMALAICDFVSAIFGIAISFASDITILPFLEFYGSGTIYVLCCIFALLGFWGAWKYHELAVKVYYYFQYFQIFIYFCSYIVMLAAISDQCTRRYPNSVSEADDCRSLWTPLLVVALFVIAIGRFYFTWIVWSFYRKSQAEDFNTSSQLNLFGPSSDAARGKNIDRSAASIKPSDRKDMPLMGFKPPSL